MPNPFESYTFEQANQAFSQLKISLNQTAVNRKFMQGDDWQDGKGWVGPHFDKPGEVSKVLRDEIKRDFAAKGSLKSVVRRHRRGVIGRVPGWQISSRNAPANPEEADKTDTQLIGDAQKVLNEFWKNSRVHQTLKAFVNDYLTTGRGVLRLFFVQTEDGAAEQAETIEDAVKLLHLFREEPEAGIVICDKETLKKASLFRYERDGKVFIEICYVDDDGQTVFRQLSQDDAKNFAQKNFPASLGKYTDAQDEEENIFRLPLNGKLLVFEMKSEAFVTPAMVSQQKLVNKAYTMLSHNLDEDGFRRRKILNGLPPGEFEEKQQDGKAVKVFVPNPNGEAVGAGSVSYTQGLPIVERDPDGRIKTTYTTPAVHESQPIDVKTFVDSAVAGSEAILEDADQKHVAISGDATASGESRIQARDEFKQSLEDTKSDLDDCMSEVFEAVLAIVAYLMGEDERYADLQVTFSAILNPGPVSADVRRVAIEERDKGVRSTESAMEEAGVTDPDAMKAKIQSEPEYLISLIKTIGESLASARGVVPIRMQAEIISKIINLDEWTPEKVLRELEKENVSN